MTALESHWKSLASSLKQETQLRRTSSLHPFPIQRATDTVKKSDSNQSGQQLLSGGASLVSSADWQVEIAIPLTQKST